MTVKEVIKELKKFPDNLPVVGYSGASEDGGIVSSVYEATSDTDSEPYYKADSPFYDSPNIKHVVINGDSFYA